MSLNECESLIVVCCHAIYTGGPESGWSEDEWLIEDFQKGETPVFLSHAEAGLKMMGDFPDESLLVYSGGATKKSRTNLTEGQSYLNLVKDNDYFKGSGKSFGFRIDPSRVIAETHATDSYQNILFSLLQFRLLTGTYPKDVTVVTHQFKEARFMNCHFQALGLAPRGELKRGGRLYGAGVIGVDPPEHITSQESLKQGEALRGIGLWRRDLYGTGPELADKRRKRGWVSGMEEDLFLNKGLEEVVEQLVCWKGGEGNEWFPRMEELPWYQDFIGS